MKAHAPVALVLAALGLVACNPSGAPKSDQGAPAAFTPPPVGKDFKLTSASITLPDGADEEYPAGPGADEMNNNCRACHSPSMVLTQPPLTHDEWAKEVDKMRTTFKAPVPDADVPKIIAYLDGVTAKQKAAAAK